MVQNLPLVAYSVTPPLLVATYPFPLSSQVHPITILFLESTFLRSKNCVVSASKATSTYVLGHFFLHFTVSLAEKWLKKMRPAVVQRHTAFLKRPPRSRSGSSVQFSAEKISRMPRHKCGRLGLHRENSFAAPASSAQPSCRPTRQPALTPCPPHHTGPHSPASPDGRITAKSGSMDKQRPPAQVCPELNASRQSHTAAPAQAAP